MKIYAFSICIICLGIKIYSNLDINYIWINKLNIIKTLNIDSCSQIMEEKPGWCCSSLQANQINKSIILRLSSKTNKTLPLHIMTVNLRLCSQIKIFWY